MSEIERSNEGQDFEAPKIDGKSIEIKDQEPSQMLETINQFKTNKNKLGVAQRVGRFFYGIGLSMSMEKSALNDFYIKEIWDKRNDFLSLDQIKDMSQKKYNEAYLAKSLKELGISNDVDNRKQSFLDKLFRKTEPTVVEKLGERLAELRKNDNLLLKVKEKNFYALKKDLEVWSANLESLIGGDKDTENSEKETKIRLMMGIIDDYKNDLNNLFARNESLKQSWGQENQSNKQLSKSSSSAEQLVSSQKLQEVKHAVSQANRVAGKQIVGGNFVRSLSGEVMVPVNETSNFLRKLREDKENTLRINQKITEKVEEMLREREDTTVDITSTLFNYL